MKRRLFNAMGVVSLVLCLAMAGLWIRSYIGGGGDWVWPSSPLFPIKQLQVRLAAGDVGLDFRLGPLGKPVIKHWQTSPFTMIYGTISGRAFFQVWMPIWMPTALLLLFPLVRAARWYRQRGVAAGLCPACGYDLRATPDRCPECGTSAAKI